MSEEDVFDEDLVRELGLDPEDLQGPGAKKKKKMPAAGTPEMPVAGTGAQAAAPVPPKKPEQGVPAAHARPPAPTPAPRPAVKPQAAPPVEADAEYAAQVSNNIPVQVSLVMAKKGARLKEILELRTGEVVEFNKMPQEPLDMVANGKLIAKAELVMVDGKIAARIVKIVK